MLKVGTILRGTYRIDSYLSSGGFGNTYVATNVEFDERVAIKEFFMKGVTQRDDNQTTVSVSNLENTNSFQEQKEKFKKEARRIRQLHNPHIVNVHDLFEENGTAYYVMDYVDGENLAERLKKTGRPMTESEVRLILPQILDALKAVHDAGIWHLDLKPANIMLEKGGNVKLIDFGASKQLNVQKGGATTSTAISYTNGYAPREQMEQNYDKFGPWTDIYALGATLYNLLTNKRPPLPTDIDDDISEDKHEALPFPEGVGGLKFLVLQMMKTNRLQRPQSIDAIMEAEKMRKEELEQAPKQQSTSQPIVDDDNDEATIIAQPMGIKENNTESPQTIIEDSNIDSQFKMKVREDVSAQNSCASIESDDKGQILLNGKRIIDFVKQPFGKISMTLLSIAITLCIALISTPSIFFLFGDYSSVQETYVIGTFSLPDFGNAIMIAHFIFTILSITLLLPLIIGFWKVNPQLSYLLMSGGILIFSKLIENELLQIPTLLNWILFYGHLLLYFIIGIIILQKYQGRIRKLGFIFIVYSIICSLLNILFYQIGINFDTYAQYACFDLLVWGIDLIQIWGVWWFLTKGNSSNAEYNQNNYSNENKSTLFRNLLILFVGFIFIAIFYTYKQNYGYGTKEVYLEWGSGSYEGNLKAGKPDGNGQVCFNDGAHKGFVYIGEFKDGYIIGHGVFKYPNGQTKYEGEYLYGKRNGQGSLYTENGDLEFKGTFEEGYKKDGYGKESGKYSNDSWEYVGSYKNGTWNGKGMITWSNGDKYEGDWKNGTRTGNGTYTFNEKRKGYGYKYVGGFLNGAYHGKGTWYYVGGGSEKCEYKNGKRIK